MSNTMADETPFDHQTAAETLMQFSMSARHLPPTQNNGGHASLSYPPRDSNLSAAWSPALPNPQQRFAQEHPAKPTFIPKRAATTYHWTAQKDKILLLYVRERNISANECANIAELIRSRFYGKSSSSRVALPVRVLISIFQSLPQSAKSARESATCQLVGHDFDAIPASNL